MNLPFDVNWPTQSNTELSVTEDDGQGFSYCDWPAGITTYCGHFHSEWDSGANYSRAYASVSPISSGTIHGIVYFHGANSGTAGTYRNLHSLTNNSNAGNIIQVEIGSGNRHIRIVAADGQYWTSGSAYNLAAAWPGVKVEYWIVISATVGCLRFKVNDGALNESAANLNTLPTGGITRVFFMANAATNKVADYYFDDVHIDQVPYSEPQNYNLSGTISANVSLAGSGVRAAVGTGTIGGSVSLSGSGIRAAVTGGTIAGQVSLAGSVRSILHATGTIGANVSLTGAAGGIVKGRGNIPVSVMLTGSCRAVHGVSGTIGAAVSITGNTYPGVQRMVFRRGYTHDQGVQKIPFQRGFTHAQGTQKVPFTRLIPTVDQGVQKLPFQRGINTKTYLTKIPFSRGFTRTYAEKFPFLRRVAKATDEYRLYRGVDAAPDFDAPAWQTFRTLPQSFALAPSHTYRLVLRRANLYGLESANLREWTITLDAGGAAVATPPSAPEGLAVAAAAGRTVLVTARYAYGLDGANQADKFLVYLTSNGVDPDPAVDTATPVTMRKADGFAKLKWTSPAYSEGATVKVLLRTRRSGGGIMPPAGDSASTNIETATATAIGPSAPAPAGAFFDAQAKGEEQ